MANLPGESSGGAPRCLLQQARRMRPIMRQNGPAPSASILPEAWSKPSELFTCQGDIGVGP